MIPYPGFHHSPMRRAMALMAALCAAMALVASTPANKPKKPATSPLKTTKFTRPAPTRPIRPEIPEANRMDTRRVFLEKADSLFAPEPGFGEPGHQIVKGNVVFRQGGMYMYCDSAYYYPEYNSLNAFGNVRMQSGDTLSVHADVLYFDGEQKFARLRNRGHSRVRLINRNVTLTTDSLDYSIPQELGWYYNGGEIDDKTSRLTSDYGQYSPATKEAEFYNKVRLRGITRKFEMNTDTLLYNTRTHVARILSPTDIHSEKDDITTSGGEYNTASMDARLTSRSLITHRDSLGRVTTLEGDSIIYDNATRQSRAYKFRNPERNPRPMVIRDTARKVILTGGYGYYNDSTRSAFATDYPLLIEYSRGDSLFLRADSIKSRLLTDTLGGLPIDRHLAEAISRARFFRSDVQGVADTIRYVEADSMLYLRRRPIVWNTNRQIWGHDINVHLNDTTADRVELPSSGIVARAVDEEFYDQLSANIITAWLDNGSLDSMRAEGNVQTIFLPQEKDSTYNKLVYAESGFLTVDMDRNDIRKLKMWPETDGKVIPLFLVKKTDLYLPGFQWYEAIRPRREWYGGRLQWADDLGEISEELEAYFAAPDDERASKRRRMTRPAPSVKAATPQSVDPKQ